LLNLDHTHTHTIIVFYCHIIEYCVSMVTARLVRVRVLVLASNENPEMGCPFRLALVGEPNSPTTTTLFRTGSLAAVA